MTIKTRSGGELYSKLTIDLKHACAEAQKKADEERAKGDGGTANLDSVLYVGALSPSTRAALTAAGCTLGGRARKGAHFLEVPVRYGQGVSRTVAVETVLHVMKDRGWGGLFAGWWQMD